MTLIDQMRKMGHICILQGKEYVMFPGLLEMAHESGIKKIYNEIISIDHKNKSAVCRCTVVGERGEFVAHGDSSPQNTGKIVQNAFIRMAETRATARALRFYLGVGMTARDELPGNGSKEHISIPDEKENITKEIDPNWERDRKWFFAKLKILGFQYDSLVEYTLMRGWDKPKHWTTERRANFIAKIEQGSLQIDL